MSSPRIGFIGIGLMGEAMTRRLRHDPAGEGLERLFQRVVIVRALRVSGDARGFAMIATSARKEIMSEIAFEARA